MTKKYCKFQKKYVYITKDSSGVTCMDNFPGNNCPESCFLYGAGPHVFDKFTRKNSDNPFEDNPDYDPLPPPGFGS